VKVVFIGILSTTNKLIKSGAGKAREVFPMKRVIPILAFLVLLVAACASPAPSSAPSSSGNSVPADQTVTMQGFKFSPAEVHIKVGQTVEWKNQDSASHTVEIAGISSGELFTGDTWTHTFATAGTFDYSCGIHPSMHGKVVVE
jgi:plastocyanin